MDLDKIEIVNIKVFGENGGSDYPVPPIYECVFKNRPTVDDKLAFHAERIVDYTVSMCG